MADILTIENLGNLAMLFFLEVVLGFDNLLYILIESRRAPAHLQKQIRFWGIIVAVALRVLLLFVMIQLISAFQDPFYVFDLPGLIQGGMNFSTLIFVFGGIFIMYTAVKEISHMLTVEELGQERGQGAAKSALRVATLIILMNLVFSFDSILTALAVTKVFWVLAAAIIASGIAMLVMADGVAAFLKKNRMYEVLGLFILLIVGVVLLGEAGPAAAHAMHDDALQIRLFGYELLPMSKTTFYFSVIVLVAVEIVQTGYQRKLAAERKLEQRR
jgi:predicted tellurium resistance membrane protein TerC